MTSTPEDPFGLVELNQLSFKRATMRLTNLTKLREKTPPKPLLPNKALRPRKLQTLPLETLLTLLSALTSESMWLLPMRKELSGMTQMSRWSTSQRKKSTLLSTDTII